MSEVTESIQQLSQQREFLLRNKWVGGNPRLTRDGELSGCLVATATCWNDYTITVDQKVARRALEWALVEMGHAGSLTPSIAWGTGKSINVTDVNDYVLGSAGEAIEILDQAIFNLKKAFGEGE